MGPRRSAAPVPPGDPILPDDGLGGRGMGTIEPTPPSQPLASGRSGVGQVSRWPCFAAPPAGARPVPCRSLAPAPRRGAPSPDHRWPLLHSAGPHDQAAATTSRVHHSRLLQGTWRDRLRGLFVGRSPTPGGGRGRRGGRGRTARCQRCRDANTPAGLDEAVDIVLGPPPRALEAGAARVAMRRPPHDGQKPRPLQENGTRRWWCPSGQRSQAKPWAGSPEGREAPACA